MNILISGGTGLIGSALTEACVTAGNAVTIISRDSASENRGNSIKMISWNDLNTYDLPVDAIVNLAGENIGSGRWTETKKKRILQSRLKAGERLAQFAVTREKKPDVFLQASAVGFYGTSTNEEFYENSPKGHDYLADVAQAWEDSSKLVETAGIRRVILRTGVVLDPNEGALARMVLPFRLFAGGRLGSGRQWLSWIHLDDEIKAIRYLMNQSDIFGAVNLCSPNPVKNTEFGKTIARVLNRPFWLPVPSLALRIILGEMSTMVLDGQKVLPSKLLRSGFSFQYPDLVGALQDLLKK